MEFDRYWWKSHYRTAPIQMLSWCHRNRCRRQTFREILVHFPVRRSLFVYSWRCTLHQHLWMSKKKKEMRDEARVFSISSFCDLNFDWFASSSSSIFAINSLFAWIQFRVSKWLNYVAQRHSRFLIFLHCTNDKSNDNTIVSYRPFLV